MLIVVYGCHRALLLSALFFCLLVNSTTPLAQSITSIKVPAPIKGTEQQYQYFADTLALALKVTEHQYGHIAIKPVNIDMVQERQFRSLDNGVLDVTWTVTTVKREEDYLAVYFPLVSGLFGYRLFLINSKGQQKFTASTTTADIKALIALQARDWPDTAILRGNGFNVETDGYEGLFIMLKKGLGDYFPRSVTEIAAEAAIHPQLQIEQYHSLRYPNLHYFFLRKSDVLLAARIEQGLIEAMQSGAFQRHMLQYDFIRKASGLLQNRKVHGLEVEMTDKSRRVYQALIR